LLENQAFPNNYPSTDYSKNKYLYNGKELQDDRLNGTFFGMLDYGARFYDPQLGRWHSMDLLGESHFNSTPYNYVMNNPLSFIDIFGLDTTKVIEIPTAYCTATRTYKNFPNMYLWNYGASTQTYGDSQKLNPLKPLVAVADITARVGIVLNTGEVLQKLTGLKAGVSSSFGIFGANFYGNQSTKIIKLTKPIKIGGAVINFIVVSADVADAYLNGKTGVEQAAAEQKLFKDILMIV
jgi:RHS repeat-associated protein